MSDQTRKLELALQMEQTVLDQCLDDAQEIVAARGGNCVDAAALVVALLRDSEVRAFVAERCALDVSSVQAMAKEAERSLEIRLQPEAPGFTLLPFLAARLEVVGDTYRAQAQDATELFALLATDNQIGLAASVALERAGLGPLQNDLCEARAQGARRSYFTFGGLENFGEALLETVRAWRAEAEPDAPGGDAPLPPSP